MAGTLVPVVLIPRYTTFSGDTTFLTVGMDVSDYSKALLSFWRSAGANPGTITIDYQESTDQNTWTSCAGGPFTTPAANGELPHAPEFTKRWFRVTVQIGNPNGVLTCWCIGFLEQRES